jgi:hypothetical protein
VVRAAADGPQGNKIAIHCRPSIQLHFDNRKGNNEKGKKKYIYIYKPLGWEANRLNKCVFPAVLSCDSEKVNSGAVAEIISVRLPKYGLSDVHVW